MEKNDKKLIRAWAMYDWANSVYSLIIASAIFPIYFAGATEAYYNGRLIPFFGMEIENSVLYSYSISFSFMVIVFLSPILSGIADFSGKKKFFMKIFVYVGATACMGMYLFDGSNVEYGIICSVIASIGFAGSLVFYNGFLPEVASVDRMDKVSAMGFSLGYIGSVILLLFNLAMFLSPDTFGFSSDVEANKFGFILVGIWWIGFAQIPFKYLKDSDEKINVSKKVLTSGFNEIKKVIVSLKENKVTQRFLISFFFYSMGVQTLIYLASLFGSEELNMELKELIIVILILQVVAILGAYFFAYLSKVKSNFYQVNQ